MSAFWQDLRYSSRILLKNPGFTLIALIALALGIGVNGAVFSIVNAYLFRPLPVTDPDRLVAIATRDNTMEIPYEVSYPNYEDIRDHSGVFSDVVAFHNGVVNLSGEGDAERAWVEFCTGNYFSMLGVEAALGRTFTPEEGRISGARPVAVLSHNYWQRRFAGDRAVVGKVVKLNSIPFTIIGVAPERFRGTENFLKFDLYLPMGMEQQMFPETAEWLRKREGVGLHVMGRLKPDASVGQARAALNVLAQRLEQDYPATNKGMRFEVALEKHARPVISVASVVSRVAAVFMALVGLVLLIACANVANLMLARATARQKEMAIRAALGASHWRLIRQLLTESIILGAAGGILGWLLAVWALDWLAAIRVSTDAPIVFDITPDWRVLAFSSVAAIMAGILSGLAPAIQSSRIDSIGLSETLKEGGRTGTSLSGRHRLRSLLIVSQVAVSLMVLICAGLFIQSATQAQKLDLGFRKENLVMLSVDIGTQGYDESRGRQFYKYLIERVKTLPGVREAALSRNTPLGYRNTTEEIIPEGQAPSLRGDRHNTFYNVIGPGYFRTMGIPFIEGRDFNDTDVANSIKVAIINETMARRLWPDQNPVGKRFRYGHQGPYLQVIGVARDSKYVFLGEEPRPFFYLPLEQNYRADITLFLHSDAESAGVMSVVRQIIREFDRELPVYDVKTMNSHLRDGIALLFVRLGAQLAGAFGLLGLVLAVVGIYGVVSYSVSQRTHEIGIRMALGAKRRDVLRLVIGEGMRLVLIGAVIGIVASLVLTRLMKSLLYGVSATDPLTFIVIALLLTFVALVACWIPARRAAKVDPMIALRYE